MILFLSGDERGGKEVMVLADGCIRGYRWSIWVFWVGERVLGLGVTGLETRGLGCVRSDDGVRAWVWKGQLWRAAAENDTWPQCLGWLAWRKAAMTAQTHPLHHRPPQLEGSRSPQGQGAEPRLTNTGPVPLLNLSLIFTLCSMAVMILHMNVFNCLVFEIVHMVRIRSQEFFPVRVNMRSRTHTILSHTVHSFLFSLFIIWRSCLFSLFSFLSLSFGTLNSTWFLWLCCCLWSGTTSSSHQGRIRGKMWWVVTS